MKNSLELQLQFKIKRANRFFVAKQYPEAIKQYTQGLELYKENRTYNESVSQQFQSILYSLRGNVYSLNLDSQQAEQDFAKSLNINPYSAVTLIRRGKHLMKEKRFSQAIQDIDLALLYDPQNLSYLSLLNSIQSYINELLDLQQKKHVSTLISDVRARLQAKPPTQSESDQQDSQQILNFSKLKKIDRKSVKLSPNFQKRKSTIQFKEDQILEYDQKQEQQITLSQGEQMINIRVSSSSSDIQEKLKKQDQQLKKLQNEQQQSRKSRVKISKSLFLTKSHNKSRKSILRKTSVNTSKGDPMVFISSPGDKSQCLRRSSISAASIKDIDGKLVIHQKQNIKFRPSMSLLSDSRLRQVQQIAMWDDKQNLARTTPKSSKRKSCLRSSNKFMFEEVDQLSKTTPNFRKSSAFLNIKSIDGKFHQKANDPQQEAPAQVIIQTQSDDDNQHNIFGTCHKKETFVLCDNMEQMPEIITKKLSKKKSILKKDSILEGSMLSWKHQNKKSVLFKTG